MGRYEPHGQDFAFKFCSFVIDNNFVVYVLI